MNPERLEFENDGGEKLSGLLERPVGEEPEAYAIFAHCFTCSKNFKAATHISRALAARGIAVLRFDFTGLGESEGDFADTTFSSNVDDLVTAAEFMEDEYEAPALLVGHSLGGAAVLEAASRIDSVRAVVTVGAPSDPTHVKKLLEDDLDDIESEGEARVSLEGRTFTIRRKFVDDLEESRLKDVIGKLKRALLVLHSPLDGVVGIDNAADIFQAAKHPKSFVSLDNADHLLSNPNDSRYAGGVIAAWARRYLDLPDAPSSEAPSGDGWVTARTGREGFFTDVRAGGHALVADEPESYGGTDEGPSPYEYLSIALATCTTMTLRMYADRKEWPLEEATVRVRHDKVHASDCGECETKDGKVDRLVRELSFEGDLDDEQRGRLVEIADKCPVHRTLSSEIVIETELSEEE